MSFFGVCLPLLIMKSHDNKLTALGKRIKYLRMAKKLTQIQLAQLSQVDVKTIKRIEKGLHNTSVSTYLNIYSVLEENHIDTMLIEKRKYKPKTGKNLVIAWWSGGVTSAVACKWALETYRNVEVIFIDTKNEHPDTYRFLEDCEQWYGVKIKRITNKNYKNISQVWDKFKSLNTAHGAICSSELKRTVRVRYQDFTKHYAQIFGFDNSEKKRHYNMRLNYPEINNIAPLIDLNLSKKDCMIILKNAQISIPQMYKLGFSNNNCFGTGCVQGGIGYWKKIQKEYPEKFNAMAEREHRYTKEKGKPVTVLRINVNGKYFPCFLIKLKGYKYHIGIAKGREPRQIDECTGFCYTGDSTMLK